MKECFVHVLTNKNNTVTYVGVTCDLKRRLWEHQNYVKTGFASKYNICKLVYYEEAGSPADAIEREKEIKAWRREKKVALIESINPKWGDLSNEVI